MGVSILETLYARFPPVLSRLLNIPQPGRLGAGGDDWHDPQATQSTASFLLFVTPSFPSALQEYRHSYVEAGETQCFGLFTSEREVTSRQHGPSSLLRQISVRLLLCQRRRSSSTFRLHPWLYSTLGLYDMAAVSSTETTTDNYYTVALGDDRKVETPTEEPAARGQADDKASRAAVRQARIAAAVERSKTEYQPEHAYTERSVGLSHLKRPR